MSFTNLLPSCIVTICLCAVPMIGPAGEPELRKGIEAAVVERPAPGDYAEVELIAVVPERKAQIGGAARALKMAETYHEYFRFPMRGDVILAPHPCSLLTPPSALTVKGGKVTGTIWLTPIRDVREITTGTISAALTNGQIEGTLRFKPTSNEQEDIEAPIRGKVIPAARMAAGNAVPLDQEWSSFLGPHAGFSSAAPGGPLVGNPAEIRLAWKSDASDIGWGMGNTPNGRTPTWPFRHHRTGSGSSSPVLVNGKVYLAYTRPAPRPEGAPDIPQPGNGKTQGENLAKMVEEAKVASADELPMNAREKTYTYLDHIMLCLDAATGQTLWKTVVKARSPGFNLTHKYWGAYNMTPTAANGRAFATSTSGWVYAYDANTGEPLWERQLSKPLPADTKFHFLFQAALLAFDNHLIVPKDGWTCLDAATGEIRWTFKTGLHTSVPCLWTHQNQRYLIFSTGTSIACVSAADGKQVWSQPCQVYSDGKNFGPGGLSISGDTLVVQENLPARTASATAGKKPAPIQVLAAYRIAPAGLNRLWELGGVEGSKLSPVHPECVPIVSQGRFVFTADLRVVDLATGTVIDEAKEKDLCPQNGGFMQTMGSLVMTRIDGTHGIQLTGGYFWLDPNGKITKVAPWSHGEHLGRDGGKGVIHNLSLHTTSYHHPLYYPMADGRIFIRGGDGIYCWDLRAAARP